MFDDMCNVENCTVTVRYNGLTGEKKMSARSALCFWLTEIAGIAMFSQLHITGIVCQYCFFLGGDIVDELLRMGHCIVSWIGRLRCNSANWA